MSGKAFFVVDKVGWLAGWLAAKIAGWLDGWQVHDAFYMLKFCFNLNMAHRKNEKEKVKEEKATA